MSHGTADAGEGAGQCASGARRPSLHAHRRPHHPQGRPAVEATLRLEAARQRGVGDANLARILDVCDKRSVAEVSALVHMPIGVVRVLLGDLIEQGHVRVQATLTEDSSQDERRELIERTLRGLRTL